MFHINFAHNFLSPFLRSAFDSYSTRAAVRRQTRRRAAVRRQTKAKTTASFLIIHPRRVPVSLPGFSVDLLLEIRDIQAFPARTQLLFTLESVLAANANFAQDVCSER